MLVDTFGTSKYSEDKISHAIRKVFRLTPKGIIESLDLLKPVYSPTAAYGHFGNPAFAWEKTDKVEALKAELA